MADQITIGLNDLWSLEYRRALERSGLVSGIKEFLAGSTKTTGSLYARYWRTRSGKETDTKQFRDVCEGVRRLALSIRDDGFNPNAWKAEVDRRSYDPKKGKGPLSVSVGQFGKIWPKDGIHRSAILHALARDIPAQVFERSGSWKTAVDSLDGKLYSPYPHPDMADFPVLRSNPDRLTAVAMALQDYFAENRPASRMQSIGVDVVGACTGHEANVLVSALPERQFAFREIESDTNRFSLLFARSWIQSQFGGSKTVTLNCRIQDMSRDQFTSDAMVGLSVYHHVATDLETWEKTCEKLARAKIHIIEVPNDDKGPWHERFRNDTGDRPSVALVGTLTRIGGYLVPKRIFVDDHYGARETAVLRRPITAREKDQSFTTF